MLYIGLYARVLRASVLEVQNEDYVRTARAKGISERRVLVRHTLRTSMITFVSLFGLDFGALVAGGVLLTEVVFGIHGVGFLTYQSLTNLDLPDDHGDGRLRRVLHRAREHARRHRLRLARPEDPARLMAEPLLEVKDLKVSFRTEDGIVRAVDGVSFSIAKGEVLGIVGESGSGKSVTMMSVMRLIIDPNAVFEGQVIYKGRDLMKLGQDAMREVRGVRDRDDLPGPDDLAQPGLPGRLADRRADPGARGQYRRPQANARADRAPRRRRDPERRSSGSTTTRTSSRAACASG